MLLLTRWPSLLKACAKLIIMLSEVYNFGCDKFVVYNYTQNAAG